MSEESEARPAPTGLGRIESIQALRFLAAAMVVCFHSTVSLRRVYPGLADLNIPGGAAGVDIFFVISGFIMSVVLARAPTTSWSFLKKRLIRIVPLYWVMTSMMAVLVVLLPAAFRNSILSAPHVAASYLFIPYVHPVLHDFFPLLVPGWTLNYEMAFYLLTALLAAVSLGRRILILGGLFLVLAAAHPFMPALSLASFYTFPIILEFLAGMILASAFLRGTMFPRSVGFAALALAVLVFGTSMYLGTGEGSQRIVFWGVPATLIVFWAIFSATPAWMRSRLAQHLGDASYATYLTHLFTLGAAAAVMERLRLFAFLPPILAFPLLVAAALTVGSLTHLTIERPLLRLLSGGRTITGPWRLAPMHRLRRRIRPGRSATPPAAGEATETSGGGL